MSGWWFSPAQLVGNSCTSHCILPLKNPSLLLLMSPSPKHKKQMSSSRALSYSFSPLPLEYTEEGGQKGKFPRSFKVELRK